MKRAALAAALVALLAAEPAAACPACRNPSLPVTRTGGAPVERGQLQLTATLSGTTVHVIHEAGCRDLAQCDEVPIQPLYRHNQHIDPVELRLGAEYGISHAFGVEVQLPLRMVRSRIQYETPQGEPYEPKDPEVHHRNETLFGLGDAWLLARAGASLGKWWVAARPGVSLPFGRTEPNPFELGDHGQRHQHVQFGIGTFAPVFIVETTRRWDSVVFSAFGFAQVPVASNSYGYRAPVRTAAGASLGTTLLGKLFGSVGPEVQHESAERWDGQVLQEGNLGRTDVYAAFAFSHPLGDVDLGVSLRLPVWRHIVETEDVPIVFENPAVLALSASGTFGAPAEH